ncbi:hypothetical protein [Gemmobacter serpentinus]|uniref:hypothetical protein n=1 Tax=Gemmobacter serpentinus TaxID=2652247 RepID=UPI00124CEF0C|nr:hypothetical protein [Gemmobacter serpentinus]
MKDIIEPLSKCGQLEALSHAIRDTREAMGRADSARQLGEAVAGEIAVEDATEALARLLEAFSTAEKTGLMDELAGYLATTYGG